LKEGDLVMLGERKANVKIGGDFDPIPMDKYTVQISDVNYKMYTKYQSTEQEEQLKYTFAILDDKPLNEKGESTRGRLMWSHVRQILNNKSNFYKLAKSAYGRDLTTEEQRQLADNPELLIGKQVDIMVEQTEKEGIVYSNIISYTKNTKPLPTVEVKRQDQTVVEKSTAPAIAPVEVKNTGVATLDDPFLDELEGKEEVEKPAKEVAKEEVAVEEDEDDPEVLEAKLKLARAKAAKKKAGK
jgi:hypothetical protein